MFNLGFGEIAVVLVVALIFLGPKLLPEIATGLGKVIREIRKATADLRQDIELDDLIRKPLQELREAATLPPEELKRRDEAKAARRKAEEEETRKKREADAAAEAQRRQAEAEAQQRRQAEAEAQRHADAEAQRQKQESADAERLQAEAEAQRRASEAEAQRRQAEQALDDAKTTGFALKPTVPLEAITATGTMVRTPPPADTLHTTTPAPQHSAGIAGSPPASSPPPASPPVASPPLRLPPPLPPPSRSSAKMAAVPSDATVVDLAAQLKAAAEMQSSPARGSTPRPSGPARPSSSMPAARPTAGAGLGSRLATPSRTGTADLAKPRPVPRTPAPHTPEKKG